MTPTILHNDKPIALKEAMYEILVAGHRDVGHGGRDRTAIQVRKSFSWIPKELISRFVRIW